MDRQLTYELHAGSYRKMSSRVACYSYRRLLECLTFSYLIQLLLSLDNIVFLLTIPKKFGFGTVEADEFNSSANS
jgi:hypothetical protein